MAIGEKVYTLGDVEGKNKETECWLVIHNRVVDITKFLDEHPGGPEVILETSGKDATQEFEDIGHSDQARRMTSDYIIGVLEGHEDLKGTKMPLNSEVVTEGGGSNMGVLVAIVAAAAGAYFYFTMGKQPV